MPRTKKPPAQEVKKTTAKTPRGRKAKQKFNFKKYYDSLRSNISTNRKKYTRYLIVVVVLILIGVFIFLKRDWFVVAFVNRQPITTVELYQNLKSKYGQDVLAQIIRDKLILQEASRRRISVAQNEVEEKIKKVEEQVGGSEQLQQALAQSNISEADFRNQIKIQLLVEKMLEDQIQVTDKEVDDFIAQNPDDPNVAGTDNSKGPNRDAIKEQLKSTKLNEKFQSWYQELEDKASILKFI